LPKSRALKADCEGWTCDVSDEESVRSLVANVLQRFGRIDVLVNNAGVMTRPTPLEEIDPKKWDYTLPLIFAARSWSPAPCFRRCSRQKSGSIINVSSDIGRGAYANFASYAASKWGLEGLTQTLASETAPTASASTPSPRLYRYQR